ncbi:MAG: zinc ABC transporter substrate-binding protein [Thiotrichales bacterium]|nr:zinc ABC transporter substrate-binding protein [Thiotrichales bacterium]
MKKMTFVLAAICASALALPAAAVQITVTIPPLAGMIAPLLEPEDRIEILLKPGVSPHGFQLKPSHWQSLQNADLLLRVGSPVDAWVNKPAQGISATHLALSELAGVQTLPIRQGGLWEKKMHSHSPEEGGEHSALRYDGHLWMAPHNAELMVRAASAWLQKQSPEKAGLYQQREQAWLAKLQEQDQQNQQQLAEVRNMGFLVLHDAYQYFEAHYGLKGVGSIRLNPEVPPSLKRMQALRARVQESDVQCVFQEPQFPTKQVEALTAGTSAKIGMLDPMGTQYLLAEPKARAQGFLYYDDFTRYVTRSLTECLTPSATQP